MWGSRGTAITGEIQQKVKKRQRERHVEERDWRGKGWSEILNGKGIGKRRRVNEKRLVWQIAEGSLMGSGEEHLMKKLTRENITLYYSNKHTALYNFDNWLLDFSPHSLMAWSPGAGGRASEFDSMGKQVYPSLCPLIFSVLYN